MSLRDIPFDAVPLVKFILHFSRMPGDNLLPGAIQFFVAVSLIIHTCDVS